MLRWKPVAGAAQYDLEIARDPDFNEIVTRERVTGAGYRWNALPTTAHHWRVRSVEADGRLGRWSAPETIAAAVRPPVLKLPAAHQVVRTADPGRLLELSVEPAEVMRGYVFQLSADPAFPDAEELKSAAPRLEVPMPAPGTWYLRARGVDVTGRPTEFSEHRKFRVALGTIRAKAPEDGAVLELNEVPGRIAASWPEIAHASSYEVEWTREPLAPEGAQRSSAVSARRDKEVLASRTPETRLELRHPGRYALRIAAVAPDGGRGDWGPVNRFELRAAPPKWVAPQAGQAVRLAAAMEPFEIHFEGAAADGFRVELSSEPSFSGAVASFDAAASPVQVKVGAGAWFGRVVARFGEERLEGEASPFAVEVMPALAAPGGQTPQPGTRLRLRLESGPIELRWSDVEGAVAYEIALAEATETLAEAAVQRSASNRFELVALREGERVWRVRAVDSRGAAGPWSAVSRLVLERPLPARAELSVKAIADGQAQLLLRLLDDQGESVEGLEPELSASVGTVVRASTRGGVYEARLVVPEGFAGPVDVTVVDRGRTFHQRVELIAPRPRLTVGGRLAFANNFAAVHAPSLVADATWRSPWLGDRLWASTRVGVYGVGMRFPELLGLSAPLSASATVVPMSVLGLYALPRWGFDFYAGAGPSLTWLRVQVGREWEAGTTFGAVGVLGAACPLWRGEASLELQVGLGAYESSLARLGTGGIGLSFGYRYGVR